jgi:hypothetical protein
VQIVNRIQDDTTDRAYSELYVMMEISHTQAVKYKLKMFCVTPVLPVVPVY